MAEYPTRGLYSEKNKANAPVTPLNTHRIERPWQVYKLKFIMKLAIVHLYIARFLNKLGIVQLYIV